MSHWRAIAEGKGTALQAAWKCGYGTVPACQNSAGIQHVETKDLIQDQPNAKFYQGS